MKKIGIIIVLLLIADVAYCVELSKSFEAGNEITINLPNEWVSIPTQVLSNVNKDKPRNQQWDYAYQPSDSENWLTYPYILIRVSNTGKVPASEFDEYKKPLNQTDNEELNKKAPSMIDNIGITERHFDDSSATYYFTTKMNIENVGSVIFKSALIFTEKGYIETGCYVNGADSQKYLPIFDEILGNIEIGASLKYRESNVNSKLYSRSSIFKTIINMTIGASIALLIYNLFRRKKKQG